MLSNQLLEFVKGVITDKRKWLLQDVECKRDGVPQRLWWLREKLNLSKSEFAKLLGIKEEDYRRYEMIGERVPPKIINRIAKVYKIPKEWIEVKRDFMELANQY